MERTHRLILQLANQSGHHGVNPQSHISVEVMSPSCTTSSAPFSYGMWISSIGGVTFSVRLTNEWGYSDQPIIYNTKTDEFYYNK